ncbi:MAG TPA: hypothetical protein VHW23_08120 [Kofleriaceae bacterium]|jgi:hypothetical protein|nr:hypothetical protein [Kofleriaceae bacterium]
MFYIADRKTLSTKVQAPFVMAEIKALRSSIFKNTMEVQQALSVAAVVEQKYDLTRADLFLPVLDSFCAILDPLSGTLLRGTLRRVGNEIFPALISVLGIPPSNVKAAMGLKEPPDLIRAICGHYSQCVVGPEAGAMSPMITHGGVTVTDTSMMPCQLQMGVFVGAGTMTGMFRDSALVEKRCRAKGDPTCVYDFTFTY